jgi:hypothetical protein
MIKIIGCSAYVMIFLIRVLIDYSNSKYRQMKKKIIAIIMHLVNNKYFMVMNSKQYIIVRTVTYTPCCYDTSERTDYIMKERKVNKRYFIGTDEITFFL